jgi:hypothetical protein
MKLLLLLLLLLLTLYKHPTLGQYLSRSKCHVSKIYNMKYTHNEFCHVLYQIRLAREVGYRHLPNTGVATAQQRDSVACYATRCYLVIL